MSWKIQSDRNTYNKAYNRTNAIRLQITISTFNRTVYRHILTIWMHFFSDNFYRYRLSSKRSQRSVHTDSFSNFQFIIPNSFANWFVIVKGPLPETVEGLRKIIPRSRTRSHKSISKISHFDSDTERSHSARLGGRPLRSRRRRNSAFLRRQNYSQIIPCIRKVLSWILPRHFRPLINMNPRLLMFVLRVGDCAEIY